MANVKSFKINTVDASINLASSTENGLMSSESYNTLDELETIAQTNSENTKYLYNKRLSDLKEVDACAYITNVIDNAYIDHAYEQKELAMFQIVEVDVESVYKAKAYLYSGSGLLCLVFKDSDGNVISSVREGSGYVTVEEVVPYNAKYAYFSYSKGIESTSYPATITVFVDDCAEDNHTDYGYVDMYSSIDTEHLTDYYLDYLLNINELTGYEVLKIKCAGSPKLKFNAYWGSAGVVCAFQDIDGNFIYFRHPNGYITKYMLQSDVGYAVIDVEIPANAYYVLTCRGYTSNRGCYALLYKQINTDDKPFNLPNVCFIPLFGQSLSNGGDSSPSITTECKYPGAIMFGNTLHCAQKEVADFTIFRPLVETSNVETSASGCAEKIIETISRKLGIGPYDKYWDNHKFLFGAFGAGSKTISDLMATPETGVGYYQGILNAASALKAMCDEMEWTMSMPAWIWMQGERDMYLETTDYKEQLTTLATNMDTDIKAITGQSEDVYCCCYQTGSQNIWNNVHTYESTRMNIPNEQMELIRDSSLFIASTPVYVLDHASEPIHLSNIGEKMCGNYSGVSISNLLGDTILKGVVPTSYTVSDYTITIEFDVPCPPLVFDTTFVKQIDNYGFTVLTTENVNIIRSVEVFDTSVTITCTQSPVGCKLYYGLNGTAYRDGRLEGARGNLCDSAKYIYNADIDGKTYTLSNYCYTFYYIIEA